MAGSQLLQLLPTDETEQKAPDVENPCGRDCGLWVLKGQGIATICGCYFVTGTAVSLVPPESKHCLSSFGNHKVLPLTIGMIFSFLCIV